MSEITRGFLSAGAASASILVIGPKKWLAGRAYTITVVTHKTAGADLPTVTGATQIDDYLWLTTIARVTTFSFVGDGSTSSKTVDYGGVVQLHVQCIVDEHQGVDLTTPRGTIVHASGFGPTASVTLPAFSDTVNNSPYLTAIVNGLAPTVKAGFSPLSLDASFFSVRSEAKVGVDLTPNMTFSAASWGAVGFELKKNTVSPGAATQLRLEDVPTILWSGEVPPVLPWVQFLDASGYQTHDTANVLMAITVLSGSVASGNVSLAAVDGAAVFSGASPRGGTSNGIPAWVTLTFSVPSMPSLPAITTAPIPLYTRSLPVGIS